MNTEANVPQTSQASEFGFYWLVQFPMPETDTGDSDYDKRLKNFLEMSTGFVSASNESLHIGFVSNNQNLESVFDRKEPADFISSVARGKELYELLIESFNVPQIGEVKLFLFVTEESRPFVDDFVDPVNTQSPEWYYDGESDEPRWRPTTLIAQSLSPFIVCDRSNPIERIKGEASSTILPTVRFSFDMGYVRSEVHWMIDHMHSKENLQKIFAFFRRKDLY
jgi:hypothetical protein